jgi:adenosylmethionine-8-amino-7-oxononanoate aminotransferase
MTHIFWRDLQRTYPTIVRGEGVYLYDSDGRRYLDGCSGALVSNIGHGVTEIADAMAAQARKVAYAHISNFATEPALRLAELLARQAPSGLKHVYYASGGSEAVETALKLARAYFVERDQTTSKYLVISRWHGFHGNTLGALAASGHVFRRRPYLPMLAPFVHIEPCNAYRHPYGPDCEDWDLRAARALERAILEIGPQYVAAFIAEPVVGATAGAVPGTRAYFRCIREICDRYDVVFIADEVMTGFGRTGAWFAVEHFDVIPDLLVMGKGMAAGYAPLAGVLVHDRIVETFRKGSGRFVHGHTYNAHPVACAAGCAVQDYMARHDLVRRAATVGSRFGERLQALRRWEIVGDVRGLGLMWGVEFVRDRATKEPFPRSLGVAECVTGEAMRRGLLVYPGTGTANGVSGDHVLLGPPLTISDRETDEFMTALDEAIGAAARLALGSSAGGG